MERDALLTSSREDMETYKRCTIHNQFCAVSPSKGAILFWSLFTVISVASVMINMMNPNPLMLMLFIIPGLYLGISRNPLFVFVIGNVLLIAAILYIVGATPMALVPITALLLLTCLSKRVAWISYRHYRQKQEYEDLFMNTMLSFAKSIDTRDNYTAFHSRNVAEYSKQIAEELGLSTQQTEAIYLAGLIHDIGKIGTPEHILRKESRLDDEEFEIMKKHPEDGYHIVKDIKKLNEIGITDMIRHHHERIDGKGYPHGLKGDAIPLGARILAAADAFDAMTTNRSYRSKLAVETAVEELLRHSGTQFDPQVTEAFLRVLTKSGRLVEENNIVGRVPVKSIV